MNNRLLYLVLFTGFLLTSCSHVQVAQTGSTAKMSLPPSNPAEILIFRSTLPAWKHQEIGVVTVRDIKDIPIIYEKMRKEAAKRGCDAIVGFRLDSEKKSVPVTQTHSGPNGAVYTTTSTQIRYVYTATGSMVYKSEGVK